MQNEDRKKLVKILANFGEIHDREISDLLVEIFYRVLLPFEIDAIERAALELAAQSVYFPKPADFVALLAGKKEDRSLCAWYEFKRIMAKHGDTAIEVEDGAMGAAIKEMGWLNLTGTLETELPFMEKQFRQLYEIYTRRGAAGPVVINGRYENEKPVFIPDTNKKHKALPERKAING